MQRTDATARPGSDNRMPDTTSPRMTKTANRLHVLVKTVGLYRIMAGSLLRTTTDDESGRLHKRALFVRLFRGFWA